MIHLIRIYILFVLASSVEVCAQNHVDCNNIADSITNSPVYINTTTMPQVIGGNEYLLGIISNNLKYPTDGGNYVGKVHVAFVVNSDGTVAGKRIVYDPSGNKFGKQILQLIDSVKWQPGTCLNELVPVLVVYPFTISLK